MGHLAVRRWFVAGLVVLSDWLNAANGDLIALDVGLDTTARSGAHVALVLREVERREREPRSVRPPCGRPEFARHSPGIADRIRMLRDVSESLQAIASVLDDEGVPRSHGGPLAAVKRTGRTRLISDICQHAEYVPCHHSKYRGAQVASTVLSSRGVG